MRDLSALFIISILSVCIIFACGERAAYLDLERIHLQMVKKMESETVLPIAWDREQKTYSSLPERERESFQDRFAGKKIRTSLKIKEFKTADMSLFQKAFEGFNYYTKEKFNFNNLMIVTGNGPTVNSIETSYVVFLPQKMLFDFEKHQTITVEGLVDSVSFTFYNCHILLYPAALVSK